MKKNLKGLHRTYTESEAQLLFDMNSFDAIKESGFSPDLAHKKSAHMTAEWRFAEKESAALPLYGVDMAGFRYLCFSAFAVHGEGHAFRLSMESRGGAYTCTLPIYRNGWNEYRIDLPFLRTTGTPAGWDRIDAARFSATPIANDPCVLYIDNLYVYEEFAAPLYSKMPELKGAAAFCLGGAFSIINRKMYANGLSGSEHIPFEEDGVIYLPMAPVAAELARTSVSDTGAGTLTFTYRRKKYVFTGGNSTVTVNGECEELEATPVSRGGNLFLPAEALGKFFHWRRVFTDPTGLVILSNRPHIFDRERDAGVIWRLSADMIFARPTGEELLGALRRRFPNPGRGRLLASFDELMSLRKLAKGEEVLASLVKRLKEEPAQNDFDAVARLAMLYRVTGDKKYSERTYAAVLALSECEDWMAEGFETFGNRTFAVALAYDWCRHSWSEGQKATLERAMLRRGLRPGLECYRGQRPIWRSGSPESALANAGMLALSIALSEVYPETACRLCDRILCNVEPCFAGFAPDGGYAEGLHAWETTHKALALISQMLITATGGDYGLSMAPGFMATADFPIYLQGTVKESPDTSMLSWFSAVSGDPIPAYFRKQALASGAPVSVFDILFYKKEEENTSLRLPLDSVYRRAGLALMRSDFGNEGMYLSLHGGSNRLGGGKLDAGAFSLSAGGVCFFENTAEGYNTYSLEGGQLPAGTAPIIAMKSAEGRAFAAVDMSATSAGLLRAKRGMMLCNGRKSAVVQDEITVEAPTTLTWRLWTSAAVSATPSRRTFRLQKDGRTLLCRLSGAADARVEIQEGNGMTQLTVVLPVKEKVRLSLACKLIDESEPNGQTLYEMTPISMWEN